MAGFTLNDLTPDTVYHIQVSAKSKRGEGAKTPTIQVRTLPFGKSTSFIFFLSQTMLFTS